ncbi:hypothetical protein [Desemzia sp. FAM 23991]|uniref:hypothetical protein n=1 Tax=unclassified Desemzia TaxID=2685243 RepID=UPI003886A363
MYSHQFDITNIVSNPDREGEYLIGISGYDAEQKRGFEGQIRRDRGGYLRGSYIDPKRNPLSRSLITRIRTEVEEKIRELRKN